MKCSFHPSFFRFHPSDFIPQVSSLRFHPSSLRLHPSDFIPQISSLRFHIGRLNQPIPLGRPFGPPCFPQILSGQAFGATLPSPEVRQKTWLKTGVFRRPRFHPSVEETAYLLQSPENAKRRQELSGEERSLAEADKGPLAGDELETKRDDVWREVWQRRTKALYAGGASISRWGRSWGER